MECLCRVLEASRRKRANAWHHGHVDRAGAQQRLRLCAGKLAGDTSGSIDGPNDDINLEAGSTSPVPADRAGTLRICSCLANQAAGMVSSSPHVVEIALGVGWPS